METGGGNKAGHAEDVDPAYHTQLRICCHGCYDLSDTIISIQRLAEIVGGSLDVRAESAWVQLAH
jgi:hypothetical protein